MITSYKNKSNYAAGVSLISLAGLFYLHTITNGMIEGVFWVLVSILVLSFVAALWWYSKAKGYWGILGVILLLFSTICVLSYMFASFSIIVLSIIWFLPDRRKEIQR